MRDCRRRSSAAARCPGFSTWGSPWKARYAMRRLAASTAGAWQQGAGRGWWRPGSQRAFGRIAGDLAYQARDQVARQAGHQGCVQGEGAGVVDLEVGGAGDAVQLVQVIGKDAGLEAAFAE